MISLQVFPPETDWKWLNSNLCKSKGEKNNYWDLIKQIIQFLGQTDIRTEEVLWFWYVYFSSNEVHLLPFWTNFMHIWP